MNYTLVVEQGTGQHQRIPIKLAQFLIGRDPQCHLRPLSPLISKRHCAILLREGKAYVRDFDSTNGTFVNDEPVKGQRELSDGDVLRLGPLVFRWQVEANAPTPAPAAPRAVDEDFMAALLLEEDGAPSTENAATAQVRSDDSTIIEMPVLPESKRDKAASPQPATPAVGNTSDAAQALLHKYRRSSHR
ncbi:MAG TPA: FHA domain-containing protein [Gemmataceae bacterium]|nr:FHA domain-containing protein [Gemmataceae bacterium]